MKKPTKKFNHWLRTTFKMHDLFDSGREGAEYTFLLRPSAPKGLRCHYVIALDYEPDLDSNASVVDAAAGLLKGYKDYWFICNLKEQLQELLAYLKSVEEQDIHDTLEYNCDYARYQVEFWRKQLLDAEMKFELSYDEQEGIS